MSPVGFHNHLTELEAAILGCFSTDGELCFPTIPGATESQIKQALASMNKKQVIKGSSPYRLTKLGKKIRSSS